MLRSTDVKGSAASVTSDGGVFKRWDPKGWLRGCSRSGVEGSYDGGEAYIVLYQLIDGSEP